MTTVQSLGLARPRPYTLLEWRRAWLAIEGNPTVLAVAQTNAGVVALHLAFFLVLMLSTQLTGSVFGMICLTLAACAAWPQRRLAIMAASGLFYVCARPFRTIEQIEFVDGLRSSAGRLGEMPAVAYQASATVLFLLLTFLALEYQRRNRSSFFARRPVLCQIGLLAVMVAAGCLMQPGSLAYVTLWTLTVVFAASFFFLSYALADQKAKDTTPNPLRLGFMRPFWGGPSIPFKGPAYLQRFEAADDEALAVTRLKALKLAVWAVVLGKTHLVLNVLFYDYAALPTLDQSLALVADGNAPSLVMSWTSLLKSFILTILRVAAFGHLLVAVIRMAGYCIPRNTARPLSSRTIAEFWNRYLFYFKEVLVDFFFYPAFQRYFKKHPRLRIAFATFCAAFAGNILFSLISQVELFAQAGPAGALLTFKSYTFYAFVLATALVVSQLRRRKPRPEDGRLRYDILPRVNVIGFFCLMQIFADERGYLTLGERMDFFLYLFGV